MDPKILTSFHIAKGGDHTDGTSALSTSVTWFTNALKYTTADAFGESCYMTYQGDSKSASHSKMIWQTVEGGLASRFPNVKIFAAEIGSAEREINDVIFNLPNQSGLGTFFWEATMSSSAWNTGALLTQSGSNYVAQPEMALYDQMKMRLESRLVFLVQDERDGVILLREKYDAREHVRGRSRIVRHEHASHPASLLAGIEDLVH